MMSLIDTPLERVTAVPLEEFKCGADRIDQLEEIMQELLGMEFWDPVYQAWRPYAETYLSSSVNPPMTARYLAAFQNKEDWLDAKPGYGSDMYRQILRLKSSSSSTVFDNYYYSDIKLFCDETCKFLIGQRKSLSAQLHAPELYNNTLSDLLERGNWHSVMCAIVLYRHCQIPNYDWPAPVFLSLKEAIGTWLDKFLTTFDVVYAFVGMNSKAYGWYCPLVRQVLQKTWSTSLLFADRPQLITKENVYSLSSLLATKLVGYVNKVPAVYDDPFAEATVWDSISALFYNSNPTAPEFCESAYKALCVPKTYFARMCDNLYDFYWQVKDGLLTERLYTRKEVEYRNGTNTQVTPKEYLDNLYSRGFPTI